MQFVDKKLSLTCKISFIDPVNNSWKQQPKKKKISFSISVQQVNISHAVFIKRLARPAPKTEEVGTESKQLFIPFCRTFPYIFFSAVATSATTAPSWRFFHWRTAPWAHRAVNYQISPSLGCINAWQWKSWWICMYSKPLARDGRDERLLPASFALHLPYLCWQCQALR